MRAKRAYLAGFGTSGSLLAGAALMFLLASAFVAFQGWPQVGGQSAPVLVSIPRATPTAATRATRALSATTTAPAHRTLNGAGTASATAGPRSTQLNPVHAGRRSDQTVVSPVSRDPGPTPHQVVRNPTPTPTGCTSNCGHTGGGSGGTVNQVKTAVHKTVTSTSQGANSTVSNTITTVKKVIGGGGSGSGNGGVVGGVVKTVKNVVGGVVGGLP